MQGPTTAQRAALLYIAAAAVAPCRALAARPSLSLATGALPPLTSAPGHMGFLDALARETFARMGIDAAVVRLPVERALINADAGIEDGDMFRAPGFEQDYPNLVQIPEKVLDFEFMAYATQAGSPTCTAGTRHSSNPPQRRSPGSSATAPGSACSTSPCGRWRRLGERRARRLPARSPVQWQRCCQKTDRRAGVVQFADHRGDHGHRAAQ